MAARISAPPPGMDREEVQALAGLIALFGITAAWWTLALWPLPAGAEWLARTRYVCFGVTDSGLPDAGGWIGLVAGPLGMFSILVVGWRGGIAGLLGRARRSRALAATLGLLGVGCAALVTGAAVRVHAARPVARTETAEVPPATYPRLDRDAPSLQLVTHTGEWLDLHSLRGRPVVVTFAYAHCTTVCPLIVRHALDAQAALVDTPHHPAVLIVTLDPWRDPPSRLPAMAGTWGIGPDAWVMSGEPAAVEATLDAWDVPRTRNEQTGEVTHPSLLYIVDGNGRIAYASTGGVDAIVSLIRRL